MPATVSGSDQGEEDSEQGEAEGHARLETALGSGTCKDGPDRRRESCRHCKGGSSHFYCQGCEIFLHDQCFEAWHESRRFESNDFEHSAYLKSLSSAVPMLRSGAAHSYARSKAAAAAGKSSASSAARSPRRRRRSSKSSATSPADADLTVRSHCVTFDDNGGLLKFLVWHRGSDGKVSQLWVPLESVQHNASFLQYMCDIGPSSISSDGSSASSSCNAARCGTNSGGTKRHRHHQDDEKEEEEEEYYTKVADSEEDANEDEEEEPRRRTRSRVA